MKKSLGDIIVVGFALFAMFFGAGNLIFPPYLGLKAGDQWLPAMVGFLVTGVGLPLLGIIAASKAGGSIEAVGQKVSEKFGRVFSIAIMLSIGPLFAIPRTAATTFEMGVEPFLSVAPNILVVSIVSVIFFLLVVYFSINPSTVIDKVGKILTPALLIALIIIIFKGIISPLGNPISTNMQSPFGNGFTEGYNTMDALASLVFTSIVVKYFVDKGYNDVKSQIGLTVKAGIVSTIGFLVVYGGLTYLGATASGIYDISVRQPELTAGIAKNLLGSTGQTILSISVALACLTTAIGLTATCADYFSKLLKGKVSYKAMVIGMSIFSCVISVVGVSSIVKISQPVLVLLYPLATVLMVLVILNKFIKNRNIYKGAVIGAFGISIFQALKTLNIPISFINEGILYINEIISKIPLAEYSLPWVIPSIICMVVASFISER